MEFVHLARNPLGKGLQKVADVYVAKDFDITETPKPIQEFRALLAREEIPQYIRDLIRKVLGLELSEGS